MKVYREGARRILAGQKKLSTILITGIGARNTYRSHEKTLTAKRMSENGRVGKGDSLMRLWKT